jgi:hypothetical protein
MCGGVRRRAADEPQPGMKEDPLTKRRVHCAPRAGGAGGAAVRTAVGRCPGTAACTQPGTFCYWNYASGIALNLPFLLLPLLLPGAAAG